jgi:hypothetical protein
MQTPTQKIFRVTVYETSLIVTSQFDLKAGFEANLKIPNVTRLKIMDKHGNNWHWIDTKTNSFNYYEVCGVLILFGIIPPSFEFLCSELNIK